MFLPTISQEQILPLAKMIIKDLKKDKLKFALDLVKEILKEIEKRFVELEKPILERKNEDGKN